MELKEDEGLKAISDLAQSGVYKVIQSKSYKLKRQKGMTIGDVMEIIEVFGVYIDQDMFDKLSDSAKRHFIEVGEYE